MKLLTCFFCLLPLYLMGCELNDLTLEEKIGQMLMVHFQGNVANDEAKKFIQEQHVGGIIYYNKSNGLSTPSQTLRLSEELQVLASIPLFIAVDQEGGIVSRVKGLTVFPGNMALGASGQPNLAESSAYVMGKELLSVGVNMNLAPVVDVNSNQKNPVIGIRSFSNQAEIVLQFAQQALKGYRRAGIITSLKHFPGHGDTSIDSHEDLPIINKTREELDRNELLPFRQLASQADTIMIGHLLVPSIDSERCATLSPKVIDILRNEFGYTGVIITDSLVMEGLLKNSSSIEEACVQAINAGNDILLLGGMMIMGENLLHEVTSSDCQRIIHYLVNAVKEGRITQERLDRSVDRILNLKKHIPLQPQPYVVNTSENQLLAKRIAEAAIRTDQKRKFTVDKETTWVIAPSILENDLLQTTLPQLGKKVVFFQNPSESEIQAIMEDAKEASCIIFCSYNAWKDSAQAKLLQALQQTKPVILIALRDALDVTEFPDTIMSITTYSPTKPSIQAAADLLLKLCLSH